MSSNTTVPKRPAVVNNLFGHTLHQNPDDVAIDFTSIAGQPLESFKYGELGFLQSFLAPGQTVVDVGANIGHFTLLFARATQPGGQVFAFEPGPRSFEILLTNLHENKYQNVTAVNKAVSDRSGETTLYVCTTGESDNRIAPALTRREGYAPRSMATVSLDDYFADFNAPIDLIKIDIQGAEYLALLGMQKLLSRNPRVTISMEFAPGGLEATIEPAKFLAFVRGMGFRIFDIREDVPVQEVTDEQLLSSYGPPKYGSTNLLLKR